MDCPWKFEPYMIQIPAGARSQLTLLSEHFGAACHPAARRDYLYSTSASYEGMTNGLWGCCVRTPRPQPDLAAAVQSGASQTLPFTPPAGLGAVRPRRAMQAPRFGVTALTIGQALGQDTALTYNSRGLTLKTGVAANEALNDPMAIIYVRNEDLLSPLSTACAPVDC